MKVQIKYFAEMYHYHNIEVPAENDGEAVKMFTELVLKIDKSEEILKPKGVAVVAEGIHTCMVIRGVEKVNSKTVTSSMTGIFLKNQRTRKEFLSLIK